MGAELLYALWETLYMVIVSTVLSGIFGSGVAILMIITGPSGLRPNAPLYRVLDESEVFCGTARPGSRSIANVTFRTPTPELDAAFVAGARARGIEGIGGHRLVGGMRASIYNAVTMESVEALIDYMRDFEAQHAPSTRSR